MKFRTKISQNKGDGHYLKNENIINLIEEKSFVDVLFLLWRGSFPTKEEKELTESLLVASVENGIEAPSVFVPRISVSTGNSVNAALASGLLSMGENHGGAAEKCAVILNSNLSAAEILERNKIVPGFGHKVYKDKDPRAEAVYQKAEKLGLSGKFFELAREIENSLEEKSGKKIPFNIDGAIAASMLEMGFDPSFGKSFFAVSRLVGMAAHIKEELDQKNSYYRLEGGDVDHS